MRSRHRFTFLCINPIAGRTGEDESFRTHSKFCDRAEVFHRVAAGDTQHGPRPIGYGGQGFDRGSYERVVEHVRVH
jgi:hypothetical protein